MKQKSMKGGRPPQDHWEKDQGEVSNESKLKYAGEMSNPQDLDKSTEGLASYAHKHKHKMKY